jgi:hypothetical protein
MSGETAARHLRFGGATGASAVTFAVGLGAERVREPWPAGKIA